MDKQDVIFFSIIASILIFVFVGIIVQNDDVIVKETSTHLYVKEYSMYNKDSVINVYKKPMRYNGIITNKRTFRHFVGVVGKGGHYKTNYYITVQYNNKTHEFQSSELYHQYTEKEDVVVEEVFYPRTQINLYKKH